MNVLDLFSGIGGFSLGLERAGMRTVAFCEIDPYCRAVLRKHWPNIPIWRTVSSLRGVPLSGLVCGWETAGVEWKEEFGCLCPDWIVIENVAHTWRRWVPELRRELWSLGYASLPIRVCAADVGADHWRARVIIIANADSERLRQLERWWFWTGRQMAAQFAYSGNYKPRELGTDDGLPHRVDRLRALGNAIVPQIAEIIGRAIMQAGP